MRITKKSVRNAAIIPAIAFSVALSAAEDVKQPNAPAAENKQANAPALDNKQAKDAPALDNKQAKDAPATEKKQANAPALDNKQPNAGLDNKQPNAPAVDLKQQNPWEFLPSVLAEVGSKKLTKEDFLAELKKSFPIDQMPDIPAEQLKGMTKRMVEGWVDKNVLLAIAEKAGIKADADAVKAEFDKMLKTVTPEQLEAFKQQLQAQNMTIDSYKEKVASDKNAQEGIAINRWIEENVANKITVPDAEIEKYYRENQETFKVQETVTAAHILITPKEPSEADKKDEKLKAAAEKSADEAAKKKAEEILAKLKQGEDFGKLAEEFSDCPSGKSAKGNLGEFSKDGQMVKEFEDAAFALEAGQTSGIVKTQFGYHIIKVTEKKKAGYMKLDEVKDFIVKSLKGKQVQDKVMEAIKAEKEKLGAKINI